MRHPSIRGTAAVALLERRAARRSTIRATLLLVFTAAGGMAPALCDSITYVGSSPGRYRYRAMASDNRWDVGDIIRLEGVEQLTDVSVPGGFTVEYTAWGVTWTCIEARGGRPGLSLWSVAGAGQIAFSIESDSPASGTLTGPQYLPEPTTTIMFCGGLMALAAAVWRRSRLVRRTR